jgi:hypothetical protein
MLGCNRCYLAHMSALDDFSAGIQVLDRLTKPHAVDGKTVQGGNFWPQWIRPCCTYRRIRGLT